MQGYIAEVLVSCTVYPLVISGLQNHSDLAFVAYTTAALRFLS